MRLLLLVFSGCNLVASMAGNSNNMNMKVLMACPSLPSLPCLPSLPSSCRNVKSTMHREVITLSSGMKVMCDTETDGGGWIIIQRRINGNIPFYRGWQEYRYGFGNYSIGEFYLGNENIHQLTFKYQHELRIDLKFNNASYYAKYSLFRILDEKENYKLIITGYSGNATDNLLNHHHDNSFSTYDKDNDKVSSSCAVHYKGGWWYSDCHASNLNGIWGSTTLGEGLNWYSLTSNRASVTFTEMKIREIEL